MDRERVDPQQSSKWILQAVEDLQGMFPFPLTVFDSDNGSEFINHEVADWLQERDIEQTRSRPYQKNDQATVESNIRYTVNHHGIELTAAEEPGPIRTEALTTGSPVPARLHVASGKVGGGKYRVHIHDDVRIFWARFTRTYSNPVAPIAFIMERYRVWEAQTSSRILKKEPLNRGILAREIKALATKDGEWVRVFYRQNCDTKLAIDPTQILEARRRHGMPFTKVAYVRNEHMEQGVNLVK